MVMSQRSAPERADSSGAYRRRSDADVSGAYRAPGAAPDSSGAYRRAGAPPVRTRAGGRGSGRRLLLLPLVLVAHVVAWAGHHVGGALTLAVGVAAAYAGYGLLPPYLKHFAVKDAAVDLAHSPRGTTESEIAEALMDTARRRGLQDAIRPGCFRVWLEENRRRIRCEYQVEVEVLPGLTDRLRFVIDVNEPVAYEEEKTKFF